MKEYSNVHLFIPLEPDFGKIMSSLMLYVYIYAHTHIFHDDTCSKNATLSL